MTEQQVRVGTGSGAPARESPVTARQTDDEMTMSSTAQYQNGTPRTLPAEPHPFGHRASDPWRGTAGAAHYRRAGADRPWDLRSAIRSARSSSTIVYAAGDCPGGSSALSQPFDVLPHASVRGRDGCLPLFAVVGGLIGFLLRRRPPTPKSARSLKISPSMRANEKVAVFVGVAAGLFLSVLLAQFLTPDPQNRLAADDSSSASCSFTSAPAAPSA